MVEIAPLPPALFSGHMELRPILHTEITNAENRRRRPNKQNRPHPMDPFSGQWNFDRVIIRKISSSYVDGVSQISEIAPRPSAPFSGHLGLRPILRPKITNEENRMRFANKRTRFRPWGSVFRPGGFRQSHYSRNKRVVHRRCFPNKRNRALSSDPFPGHLELRPMPRSESINAEHRRRFPSKRNRSPANGSVSQSGKFRRVIIAKISASYIECVSQMGEMAPGHRLCFPARWNCDPFPDPKLHKQSAGGVSK